MKNILLIPSLLFMSLLMAQPDDNNSSQNTDANNRANTNKLQVFAGNPYQNTAYTGQAVFFNPKFDREGSVYLFDRWDNTARVYPKTGGFFTTSNMNFNIQRSMFESKKSDSIRGWNFASIEKINLGGKTFKSYYFEPLKRQVIFEVIFEGEDFAILKRYETYIQPGNPNPMIGRMRDKIIQTSDYFVDTPTELKEIRFNKRNILDLLDKEKRELAEDYARKYEMSFRDENDLQKILNFIQHQ